MNAILVYSSPGFPYRLIGAFAPKLPGDPNIASWGHPFVRVHLQQSEIIYTITLSNTIFTLYSIPRGRCYSIFKAAVILKFDFISLTKC